MHAMLDRALPGPSTLQLTALSMEQAECLLAAIWCVLEAHGVASPTLEVRPAAGLIAISLAFRSAEDCSLVEARWANARRRPRHERLPRATNLAPQMVTGTSVSASATAKIAKPPPRDPDPAPQPVSRVDPSLPGHIPTGAGESCLLSMPPPERVSRGCRFITGDPKDFHALGEAIYCGSPVERIGEPWCAKHRRICYGTQRSLTAPTWRSPAPT
jgi:hypothetical protein